MAKKVLFKKEDIVVVKETHQVGQVTNISADGSVVAVRLNNGGSAEYLKGELMKYEVMPC